MLAVLMTRPGGPDVLEARELSLPELPSSQHVRVRLHAAGVNPLDAKLRKGGTYYPDRLPAILGCDGAGVVDTVGAAVTRFHPGDAVYFFHGGIGGEPGNYAQHNVVHQDHLARMPANLSFTEAAAVPLVLITAWEALHDRARLEAGERVLIHAAAGGVGHVALQLAKRLGAQVAVTVRGDDKFAFAKSFGADRIIDYTSEDFVRAALDWTDGAGVDATVDTVGGETFCRSFAATKVYGRVVTLLQTACDDKAMKLARLRNQSVHYELMLAPMHLGLADARRAQTRLLKEGARLLEDGRLRVHLGRELPLRQAAEAHRLIEAGHTTGKIVLRIE
jgi:NADPH2:quinone reductase